MSTEQNKTLTLGSLFDGSGAFDRADHSGVEQ